MTSPDEALRESESRHRMLATLADATQPLTSAVDIMAVSAHLLAEHLRVDRCAYAEVENEILFVITGDHSIGVPSIVGRWPVAAFGDGCVRCMRANQPFVVANTETDPRITPDDRVAYEATNIRAVICVPLHKGGRFTAAMAVHQSVPRHWTPAEVRLVAMVVARCWETLERAAAEAHLVRVRDEYERRQRLYETALSNTPDLVYVFDLECRFTYANQALLRMWGKPWDEAIGRTCLELGYEPWHASMHEREIAQVRATRQVIRGEVPFTGTDGRRVYDYILAPVFDADGEVEAVAGTARDVTERQALEQDLRNADRRKDEFIALLAHELRNPLAPIRNGLKILQRADATPDIAGQTRGMMDRQLSHMVRLIDDLLDASRLNRSTLVLQRARVTLAEVLASAVETAQPLLDEHAHTLVQALPGEYIVLNADLTRLAQVFSNLLINSIKYTPPAGTITLSAERRGPHVAVRVSDTGIGIPAASLATLFDMFSQVTRNHDRPTSGLGIGLALVKSLVELHDGTVAAASDGEGRGATFTVVLPVEMANWKND